MIDFFEPEIIEALKKDSPQDIESYFKNNLIDFTYKTSDGWDILSLSLYNDCFEIFYKALEALKSTLSTQELDDFFRLSSNSTSSILRAQESEPQGVDPKYYKALTEALGEKGLKKLLEITKDKEVALGITKKLFEQSTDKDNILIYGSMDLGAFCIKKNFYQCVEYLVESEYKFSNHNQMHELQSIAIDNSAWQTSSLLCSLELEVPVSSYEKLSLNIATLDSVEQVRAFLTDLSFSSYLARPGEGNLFLNAIKEENIPLVDYCISKKVNFNAVDGKKSNAAHLACELQNVELLKKVRDIGVPLSTRDESGNTPAIIACATDNEQLVKTLFDGQTAISLGLDEKNTAGFDAMTLALNNKNLNACRALMWAGVNVPQTQQKTNDDELLGLSVQGEDSDMEYVDYSSNVDDKIVMLQNLGFNFLEKNEIGDNLLINYIKKNNTIKNITSLVSMGLEPLQTNEKNQSALCLSLLGGNVQVAKYLLDITNIQDFSLIEKEIQVLAKNPVAKIDIINALLLRPGFITSPQSFVLIKSLMENSLDNDDRCVLKDILNKDSINTSELMSNSLNASAQESKSETEAVIEVLERPKKSLKIK